MTRAPDGNGFRQSLIAGGGAGLASRLSGALTKGRRPKLVTFKTTADKRTDDAS